MEDNWDMPNYTGQEPVYIDEMKTVRELTAQLLAAETRVRALEEALKKYGDKENWCPGEHWENGAWLRNVFFAYGDGWYIAKQVFSQPSPAPSQYADVLGAAFAFAEGRKDDTGYGQQLKNAEKLTSAVEALPEAERAVWRAGEGDPGVDEKPDTTPPC